MENDPQQTITPLRISNAQSASPCSFITAPEGGVFSEAKHVQRCNTFICDTIIQLNISSGNPLEQALSNTRRCVQRHEHKMDKKIYCSIQSDIVNFRQLNPNQINYIANSSPEDIIEILQVYNKMIHYVCCVLCDREH